MDWESQVLDRTAWRAHWKKKNKEKKRHHLLWTKNPESSGEKASEKEQSSSANPGSFSMSWVQKAMQQMEDVAVQPIRRRTINE